MKHFFNRFLLLFFKMIAGVLLGCFILLFYASHSKVVQEEIKKSVQHLFEYAYDCHWDGKISSIDLLSLQLEFSDVSITPCRKDDGWSLYTHKFYISARLFDFLVYRKFSCHGYFDQVIVYEQQKDSKSHFAQVIAKMFEGDLPTDISFDYMTINQGQFILKDSTGDLQGSYQYNCQMSRESDGLHTKLYVRDAYVTYKNNIIFQQGYGNFVLIVPYDYDMKEIYARVDCRLSIPALQDKGDCFLVGDIYRARGAFVVSNEDQSFIIEPLKIKIKKDAIPYTCSMTMAADIVQKILFHEVFDADITGSLTCSCSGNLLNLHENIQGKIQVAQVAYKNNNLVDQACISLHQQDQDSIVALSVNHKIIMQGTCQVDQDHVMISCANIAKIQSWINRYWYIPIGKGNIDINFDPKLCVLGGDYQLQLHSDKLNETHQTQGVFKLDMEELSCSGTMIDKDYSIVFQFQPIFHLKQLRYCSSDEVFIDLHEELDPLKGTVGFVDFNCIKNMVSDAYKSSFSQPGRFNMSGNLQNGGYHAHVNARDAHIRIPFLYNVIQDFSATTTFDIIGRSIILDSMMTKLYEGTVHCHHAIATFDNNAQVSFIHAPLFLDNVLMSWTKGIFGTVSGRVFLSKLHDAQPQLQGNLIVDKAQIKGNIFSQEFQEQLLGAVGSSSTIDTHSMLDLTIETKEPIAVETSFLHAMVHLDLHLGNTIKQPELEGTIDIASGELKFPYKSLYITRGQIVISPKNPTDSSFEFVAKGKIKRYNITMHATGNMSDQHIHFEASPYLTEEQIISLLLVGSHEGSLSAVMPVMFMQKLQEIIFGPAISKSKLDIMFNRLLQSFKNIRIYPQFSNQTGRGGVRGIVEIDATDRLHGRIDSNLMQLEDTIFEADYLLTDDVTVRAIKDGPSTYGGEVEMRWKFS